MNATTITATLALQKYWNSNVYSQAAKAIAVYSQRLSKSVGEWAAQDANCANLLQQCVYPLSQKEEGSERYNLIPTDVLPLSVPPIKPPKPEQAESTAIDLLNAIAASEHHCSAALVEAAQNPTSKPILQVLDLDALSQASAARVQEALEMIAMIKEGRLWESPTSVKWRCLQCGARTHSKKAFESCACCKAGRAFATPATF